MNDVKTFLEHNLHGSFLPFEMPSRKDNALQFVHNALWYLIIGALILWGAGSLSPGIRSFPTAWIGSLESLRNYFQIVINAILTLTLFSVFSFSVGLLLVHFARPIDRVLRTFLLERLHH
ncbi:MAG: hypothetical protein WA212_04020 [Candidatus Acidiferrales bacterium]